MTSQENINDSIETMFFLGAGASVPAGIQDVVKLVDDLVDWVDSDNKELSRIIRRVIEIIHGWEKIVQ